MIKILTFHIFVVKNQYDNNFLAKKQKQRTFATTFDVDCKSYGVE